MLETTPGICNYFQVTKKAMSLCHIIYIYFCNIVALEPFEGSSHQEEPVLDLFFFIFSTFNMYRQTPCDLASSLGFEQCAQLLRSQSHESGNRANKATGNHCDITCNKVLLLYCIYWIRPGSKIFLGLTRYDLVLVGKKIFFSFLQLQFGMVSVLGL